MTKVRQDAWSEENDLLLAETVLRHIREGSTQLNAFEEVGDLLNRTSAACGFRWNAVVRNQYEQAIELAKRQRKEMKRKQKQGTKPLYAPTKQLPIVDDHQSTPPLMMETGNEINFDDVMHFLQSIYVNYDARNHSLSQFNEQLERNKQLQEENQTLKANLEQMKQKLSIVEEDYKAFIQIMDRARKMAILDEDEATAFKAPAFKMDKNGNLEQYMG